jgi:hypothetical protein
MIVAAIVASLCLANFWKNVSRFITTEGLSVLFLIEFCFSELLPF